MINTLKHGCSGPYGGVVSVFLFQKCLELLDRVGLYFTLGCAPIDGNRVQDYSCVYIIFPSLVIVF